MKIPTTNVKEYNAKPMCVNLRRLISAKFFLNLDSPNNPNVKSKFTGNTTKLKNTKIIIEISEASAQ